MLRQLLDDTQGVQKAQLEASSVQLNMFCVQACSDRNYRMSAYTS